MLPRWGPLAVALRSKGPRGRGRGGSRGGHGDPRPARRCSPGRAGLSPTAAPASARSPASHPAPGQWPSGWDLRARRVRAVEVGGFRRPRRLSGLGAGAGNPGAASAPDPGEPSLRGGVAQPAGGNPDKGGAPLADPRAPARGVEAPLATPAPRQLGVDCEEVPRLPLPEPVRGKSRCDCRESESAVTSQALAPGPRF